MPTGPAARITDNVLHPLPPVLTPGPGSLNVLIGFLPAWRGVPAAVAGALSAAKNISETTIKVAEAATVAAAGTPGAPAAKLAEETTKAAAAAAMGSMISSMGGMSDIHLCTTPLPIPPHGPGVVIDGSPTVLINNLPACRLGDTILEAIGPPNKIVKGEFTVIIGQSGGGAAGGGGGMPGAPGMPAMPDAPQVPSPPAPPPAAAPPGATPGAAGGGGGAASGPGPAPSGAAPSPSGAGPSQASGASLPPLASKKLDHAEGKGSEPAAAPPPSKAPPPAKKARVSREQALADVLAEAEKLGVAILTDDDPEIKAYMDDAARREGIPPEAMHAITLSANTIVIRKELKDNVRVLREELIHTQQQMENISVGPGQDMITALELDARRQLLQHVDEWALTDEEVAEIAKEIATIEKRGKY